MELPSIPVSFTRGELNKEDEGNILCGKKQSINILAMVVLCAVILAVLGLGRQEGSEICGGAQAIPAAVAMVFLPIRKESPE